MCRRPATLALNGTAGVQASGKGLSSYTAQLPTPTGRSVQQGVVDLDGIVLAGLHALHVRVVPENRDCPPGIEGELMMPGDLDQFGGLDGLPVAGFGGQGMKDEFSGHGEILA